MTSESGLSAVADSAVFQNFAVDEEVLQFVSPGWREYLTEQIRITSRRRASITIASPFKPRGYANPFGNLLNESYPPNGGPGGSNLGLTVRHHLEPNRIGRAVFCHDVAAAIPGYVSSHIAGELTRALNRWLFEVFLPGDGSLAGALLVQTQSPELAAKEIRELGADARCAAVMLHANAFGKPFGHPVYHPIYAAAAEMSLPIMVLAGGDVSVTVLSATTAGGAPSFYTDYRALLCQSLMTHAVSMIVEGIFDRFPDLKLFLLGGGVGWITPFLLEFEKSYKAFRRDAPWLRLRAPDYFAQNVRVSTYPLDRTDTPERLARYLKLQPEIENILCYASGYPNWDRDTVADIEAWVPREWLPKVLWQNAEDLFRWPSAAGAPSNGR
jgi:predicted TIM-barrel fold metal-dependent hydrolase